MRTQKKGQPHGLPFYLSVCCLRRTYFGACTRIRFAVIVKVPLMLEWDCHSDHSRCNRLNRCKSFRSRQSWLSGALSASQSDCRY